MSVGQRIFSLEEQETADFSVSTAAIRNIEQIDSGSLVEAVHHFIAGLERGYSGAPERRPSDQFVDDETFRKIMDSQRPLGTTALTEAIDRAPLSASDQV